VTDTFPGGDESGVRGRRWVRAGAIGFTAAANNQAGINDTVSMPVGSTITYTVTGTISPSATGDAHQHRDGDGCQRGPLTRPRATTGATDTDTLAGAGRPVDHQDRWRDKRTRQADRRPIRSWWATPDRARVTGAVVTDTFAGGDHRRELDLPWRRRDRVCGAASGTGNIVTTASLLVGGTADVHGGGADLGGGHRQPGEHGDGDAAGGGDRPDPRQQQRDRYRHAPRRQADLSITKTDGRAKRTRQADRRPIRSW